MDCDIRNSDKMFARLADAMDAPELAHQNVLD